MNNFKRKNQLFVVVFLLITIFKSTSQNFEKVSYDLTKINQLHIKSSCFITDSDGFLWFCTTNGKLIKDYGKRKFIVPLPSDLIFDQSLDYYIFQDKQSNIWIGCNQGAYLINPYTFESKLLTWKPKESSSNTGFLDFVQKKDGTIWVTTESNHLISFKDYNFSRSYKIPLQEKESQLRISINNDKPTIAQISTKILNHKKQKIYNLFIIDNNEIKFIDEIPYKSKLLFLPKGTALNKSKGIYIHDKKQYTYLNLPKINACALIRDKSIFDTKIYRPFFNKTRSVLKDNLVIERINNSLYFQKFKVKSDTIIFNSEHILKNQKNSFYVILNDERHLIIGESNRIHKIKLAEDYSNGISHFLHNNKAPISTRGISIDSLNNIYVASYSGLFKIDSKNKKESLFFNHEGINSTIQENDTILWGVETNNLHRINLKTRKKNIYEVPRFSSVLKRKNENELWVGTSHGLYIFNKNTHKYVEFNQLNKYHSLKNSYIRDILQLPDNTLWIATHNNGAFFYNLKTKNVTQYSIHNNENYIPHKIVLDIYKDKYNSVWIAGNHGLTKINQNKEIINYTINNGLSNNIVCGILETKNHIWASTYNGINKIEISNESDTNSKIHHLLDGVEFNHKSLLKKNDSILFFGSINGIYKINTNQITYNDTKVKIHPVSIKSYDKTKDSILKRQINSKDLKTINLDYSHNFFELEFALNNTFDYNNDSYSYFIEGLTPSWIDINNQNVIRQYGIPAGNYTLKVIGNNDDGILSSNILSIPIHVAKVFYKTTFFIISLIIFTLIFTYLWFLRIKKSREKNGLIKDLENKALRLQMNPHFIFNTINGIQSDLFFKNSEIINDHITSFSRLLRITMDMTLKNTIRIQKELDYLESYIKLQRHRLENTFSYEIKIAQSNIDLNEIEIPSMLLQPLIENAIIHGLEPKKEGPKLLTLSFCIEKNIIIVSVDDNGVGRKFKKSKKNHKSHALRIMESRININNQINKENIFIETIDKGTQEKPLGTKITLKIPFKKNNLS